MTFKEADTLGKRIRYFRRRKKMSCYALAPLLEMSRPALTMLELGVNMPDAARIVAIATLLDITPGDLFPPGWHPRLRKSKRRLPLTLNEGAAP